MTDTDGMDEVKAIVFDLDGVLLESEQVWAAVKRELTADCGGTWKAAAEHEMLGMSSPEWSRYMHDELGLGMREVEISRAVVERMVSAYGKRLPVIAGADEAVRRLSARWPLGLASASNREIIDVVMELTGWGSLFAVTVSAEEVEQGKPQPDVYLEAVRRLGQEAEHCVAIEDSSAGIRSAAAAGLAVIAIPNPSFPPGAAALELADLILESIADLAGEQVLRAGSR